MKKFKKLIKKSQKQEIPLEDCFSEEYQNALLEALIPTVSELRKQMDLNDLFGEAVTFVLTELYGLPREALPATGSTISFAFDSEQVLPNDREVATAILSFCVAYLTKLHEKGQIKVFKTPTSV